MLVLRRPDERLKGIEKGVALLITLQPGLAQELLLVACGFIKRSDLSTLYE